MMRIRATKSSLYKLVISRMKRIGWNDYVPMRYTAFSKVPRSPSYFLAWTDYEFRYQAYFTTIFGRALLTVTKSELYYGGKLRREVFHVGVDELEQRCMLDKNARK